jgi:hypothetical protein
MNARLRTDLASAAWSSTPPTPRVPQTIVRRTRRKERLGMLEATEAVLEGSGLLKAEDRREMHEAHFRGTVRQRSPARQKPCVLAPAASGLASSR